ncbi:MAG: alanine dehydrogenase [Pseudomonadota bacterium]|nr:alanine dehydrogenase [Pseudomonadota bacterium]
MRIGVPKEIKHHEYRVGLPPAGVVELVNPGHEVMIETHAGEGAGFSNEDYVAAGATIVDAPATILAECDMIVKVKEPQPDECRQLRPGQLLFTYLHLAADRQQTDLLMESGATCIAYETVEGANGGLPLLAPMSEIAGRLAAQAGGDFLKKSSGGRGVLLGGVPGVAPAKVVVIGGGVVGTNAARVAHGMGARVVVLDRSLDRLRYLDDIFMGRIETVWSSAAALEEQVMDADLIIGAVLIPGAAAPKLVSRDLVSKLQKGSVMVDVAIDQGGCFETSHATSYQDPTYEVDGVVHYCVANMPGGVARTATLALTNATLPYVVRLADQGLDALRGDPRFALGLNVHVGKLTHAGVGEAFSLDAISPAEALIS